MPTRTALPGQEAHIPALDTTSSIMQSVLDDEASRYTEMTPGGPALIYALPCCSACRCVSGSSSPKQGIEAGTQYLLQKTHAVTTDDHARASMLLTAIQQNVTNAITGLPKMQHIKSLVEAHLSAVVSSSRSLRCLGSTTLLYIFVRLVYTAPLCISESLSWLWHWASLPMPLPRRNLSFLRVGCQPWAPVLRLKPKLAVRPVNLLRLI